MNKNKLLRIIVSFAASILNIIRKEFIREKNKPKRRRIDNDDFYQGPPGTY